MKLKHIIYTTKHISALYNKVWKGCVLCVFCMIAAVAQAMASSAMTKGNQLPPSANVAGVSQIDQLWQLFDESPQFTKQQINLLVELLALSEVEQDDYSVREALIRYSYALNGMFLPEELRKEIERLRLFDKVKESDLRQEMVTFNRIMENHNFILTMERSKVRDAVSEAYFMYRSAEFKNMSVYDRILCLDKLAFFGTQLMGSFNPAVVAPDIEAILKELPADKLPLRFLLLATLSDVYMVLGKYDDMERVNKMQDNYMLSTLKYAERQQRPRYLLPPCYNINISNALYKCYLDKKAGKPYKNEYAYKYYVEYLIPRYLIPLERAWKRIGIDDINMRIYYRMLMGDDRTALEEVEQRLKHKAEYTLRDRFDLCQLRAEIIHRVGTKKEHIAAIERFNDSLTVAYYRLTHELTSEEEAYLSRTNLLRSEQNEALKMSNYKTASELQITRTRTMIIVVLLIAAVGMFFVRHKYLKTQQQLQDAADKQLEISKMAVEDARLKNSFLANMSHEIRAPLNAIVGFSDILASGLDMGVPFSPEETAEFRDSIDLNSEFLRKLVDNVMYSHANDCNDDNLDFEEMRLQKVLVEIFRTHTQIVTSVPFEYDGCDDTLYVNIDRLRFTQIISNFLTNANKFTHQGSIHLGCYYTAATGEVTIYVKDTGIGIQPEKLKKCLEERFYKANEDAIGTGIGLSLCKTLAAKLNGRVEATSIYGKGSTFSFIMPCKKYDQPA